MNNIEKCEKALSKLVLFLSEKNVTEAVKAGIIQAFEYNYDVFWKAFKKLAVEQGFEDPQSPRKALASAFQLKIIDNETIWIKMMKDRNDTSHTYNEDLANQIYEKIKATYKSEFENALAKIKSFKS
jgi:nucleotidyltransferase substrate binding protein (TIGR01987 family)